MYNLKHVEYKLRPINTKCYLCKDLVESRKRITWGYGDPESPIMFIGEAPGRFGCDITGIPFTQDASGMLFQSVLSHAGWSMEDVYTTNIVKCCPKGNRTPTDFEIDQCSSYLEYEIEKIKPMIAVLLGGTAMKYFFPKAKSVTANWNRTLTLEKYSSITFMILPHPAYIVRNRQEERGYLRDFVILKYKLREKLKGK